MKKSRLKLPSRFISYFTALIFCTSLTLYPLTARCDGNDLHLSILHISDLQDITPTGKNNETGGFARLKTILDKVRRKNPQTLFLLSGDFLSPSLMSSMLQGKQIIDLLNRTGLNYATLGNHEFDFGIDVLKKRIAQSKFTWVVSNVMLGENPFPGTISFAIHEIHGGKIGIMGLLTPETKILTRVPKQISISDFLAAAKRTIKQLKAAKADVIIALTHLNYLDERSLAQQVPEIDLILGGHDHIKQNLKIGNTLIVESGAELHTISLINYVKKKNITCSPTFAHSLKPAPSPVGDNSPGKLNAKGGDCRSKPHVNADKAGNSYTIKVDVSVKHIPLDKTIPADPQIRLQVKSYTDKLNSALNVVIGNTTVPLNAKRTSNRTEETNLGNFIADTAREAVNADIGLLNGGGIRTDTIYPAGKITPKIIRSILPFKNLVVKLKLSGKSIKQILEHSVSHIETAGGGFPQVSGMTFFIDISKPAGNRISNIQIKKKPLALDSYYTLATNDFLANGGEGFDALKTAERLVPAKDAQLLADMVVNKIKAKGTISPTVTNRIIFIK